MSIYTKAVSWSKVSLAYQCPRRLQKVVDKDGFVEQSLSREAKLGIIVQKCYELYFNGGFNLKPRGDRPEVVVNILNKVLQSPQAIEYHIVDDAPFKDLATDMVTQGYASLKQTNLLPNRVQSEYKLISSFQHIPLYGMVDFYLETPEGIYIYDGKGYKEENADPRQLLFYALGIVGQGKRIAGGGFIYWKQGYRPVDMSPSALYNFSHFEFSGPKEIILQLRKGVSSLPATPSSKSCCYCPWKKVCEDSYYYKEYNPPSDEGISDVPFR